MTTDKPDNRSGPQILKYVVEELGAVVTRLEPAADFDKAIIGYEKADEEVKLVYGYDNLVDVMQQLLQDPNQHDVDDPDGYFAAQEFVEYNTIRALDYIPNPPIIKYTEYDSED